MDVTIVCRKRIANPQLFDQLVEDTKAALAAINFDSIRSQLNYDPDNIVEGDVVFTTKE